MRIPRNVILFAATAALSSAVTYFVTDSANEKELDEMRKQIAELEKKEREAVVTQRISEQMEDIAFQQKAASDIQRERAIEQSKIADMERGKAEIERGLALAAQHKAVEAAAEAKRQAEIAEAQTVLATNNMIAAEEARAHADTLFYLARANSLAQTSLQMSANGSTDLSRLLSYASWHYTNEYGGDKYQQDLFSSLLRSSEGNKSINLNLKGSIRKVDLGKNDKHTYVFGVTDYGEAFVYGTKSEKVVKTSHNFRDLVAIDTANIVALDIAGTVASFEFFTKDVDYPAYKPKETYIGEGKWTHLLLLEDKKTLVAMSEHSVVWLNMEDMQKIAQYDIEGYLTVMGMEGNRLHMFADGGQHYYSDVPGKVEAAPMSVIKERVTAYHYDNVRQYHILGLSNGIVYIIGNDGNIKKELIGHNGSITHLTSFDNLLATSSYDHTLRFWSIRDLSTIITPFEQTIDKWPLSFVINPKSSLIWIGTEGGGLMNFHISAARNAETTKKKLTREFTPEEWNYYIGKNVPYKELLK